MTRVGTCAIASAKSTAPAQCVGRVWSVHEQDADLSVRASAATSWITSALGAAAGGRTSTSGVQTVDDVAQRGGIGTDIATPGPSATPLPARNS